jgi:seryl-tRNA synthetase
MIDIQLIRNDVEGVIKDLEKRGKDFSYLRELKKLDEDRRANLQIVEKLKSERNDSSKTIGVLKKEGKDTSVLMSRVANIGVEISRYDKIIGEIDEKIRYNLLITPNILHSTVPFGRDESQNVEVKKYLEPTKFTFEPKSHYELGEKLDIIDFARAAKITGSRFVVYKGLGARLERALIQFMMDLHSDEHGYKEVIPPYIVNKASMTATGQLPKFEEDAFKLVSSDQEWYLNPTAEVPTINMFRDEVIPYEQLPIKLVSYTMAFRSEAGSAGRDTRGLIRTHQFNKVELIKITDNKTSWDEHEKMLLDSESVLQALKIPYHVINLCSGDMGASMAKTYDIEVWLPSQNTYREIGSISNAQDYQARRGNIRYRNSEGKVELAHTLNGSGLAVGRTWVAIVENYQQEDGSIKVPDVLVPYMRTQYIK